MESYNTKSMEELIREWNDAKARETNLKISTMVKHLYETYEPSLPPEPKFWSRLEHWLKNFDGDTKTQKIVFNSIPNLFYIGPDEFIALFKYAYDNIVGQWLVNEKDLMLDDPDISDKLKKAVKKIWFCPISDSMRINSFSHVNNVPSRFDHRPDWRSLAAFGDINRVVKYCEKNEIEGIVLLEDFVGGGNQMSYAIDFAAKLKCVKDLPILVIPLVVCPKGAKKVRSKAQNFGISCQPALEVGKQSFISKTLEQGESCYHTELRKISNATYSEVSGGKEPGAKNSEGRLIEPYHPLGWDETGGLIVMYTNTPNNTLPFYHWRSENWVPLFPRHSRV